MKLSKSILASALIAASGVAQAEFSGNIGAVSDYVFRGVSLSGGDSAIQGGLDYANESGFYAGTWLSSLGGGGEEVDVYAGFAGEAGSMSYDLGALYYYYPATGGDDTVTQAGELDYAEAILGLGFGPVSATIAYTFWDEAGAEDVGFIEGDIYYGLSADLPMDIEGFGLSIYAGYYDFEDDSSSNELNYTHWGASLSKDVGDFGAFSFNYDQTDGDEDQGVASDDDAIFSVAWTKGF